MTPSPLPAQLTAPPSGLFLERVVLSPAKPTSGRSCPCWHCSVAGVPLGLRLQSRGVDVALFRPDHPCIASYFKGIEFLEECKRQGATVILGDA